MLEKLKNISGDRQLWVYTLLLMLLSSWFVYSASSNLAVSYGKASPFFFGVKHIIHLFLGLIFMYVTHKMNPRYFAHISRLGMPVIILVLLYTLAQGYTMGGANASRWISVPMVGSVQPSTIAFLIVMMFTARFFGKNDMQDITFKQSMQSLWIWIFMVEILILPSNFSTAALIFLMVLMMTFIAGYPIKYLFRVMGIGLLGLVMFILVIKAFPNKLSNRLDTWQHRIENYLQPDDVNPDVISQKNYQQVHAKIAIAKGGLVGFRPGKSVEKNFLPQSVSDFLFAIIIEEYSFIGGLFVIFIYLMLGLRMVFIAKRAENNYYKLLVLAVGLPIIFQAMFNMAVAVGMIPVTGQPLPLLSSGGTSVWMSSIAIGIILSVSRQTELKDKETLDEFVTA